MRFSTLALFTSTLFATHTFANIRHERKNVAVAQLDKDQIVPRDAKEIPLKASSGPDFKTHFKCCDSNKQFSFLESDCKKWVACCPRGRKLTGSESTAFDCCEDGQELVGSKENEYKCGPEKKGCEDCNIPPNIPPPQPCPSDRFMVNGHCLCLPGTQPSPTGKCIGPDPPLCPSDRFLVNGHCVCLPGTHPSSTGQCVGTEPPKCTSDRFLVNNHCVCLPNTHPSSTGHCTGTEPPTCPSDRFMVNGHCLCHPGTQPTSTGQCISAEPPCPSDRISVNGHCVCFPGTYPSSTGVCGKPKCPSGIEFGKCYSFTFENGLHFGYNSAGFYRAAAESRDQQFGKFQFCPDVNCTTLAEPEIQPGYLFYIKDIHGSGKGDQGYKQWLNNAKDGDFITKTAEFTEAGIFSITKWPSDKYCLGGFAGGIAVGLGLAGPEGKVGATFSTVNDQSCIPMAVLEIPCDIRSVPNNCIWPKKSNIAPNSATPVSGSAGDQQKIL